MRRFKGMTNREWVQKHSPENINEMCYGGVYGCPVGYGLEINDCRYKATSSCLYCYNLPAKRNGRYLLKEVSRK